MSDSEDEFSSDEDFLNEDSDDEMKYEFFCHKLVDISMEIKMYCETEMINIFNKSDAINIFIEEILEKYY